MKYKLAHIDENLGDMSNFYQYFKNDFEILRIQVTDQSTIESIVKEAFENNVDAIVTDYKLEGEVGVDFNGDKIFDFIKSKRPHFPVVVFTSHEKDAIDFLEDVHIIYDKIILDGDHPDEVGHFVLKLKANIQRYYSKIENTEKEIENLVAKKNAEGLNPSEEEALTKLYILMDELDPEGKELPANLIQSGAITKLNDFVSQTKEILEELKKANKK